MISKFGKVMIYVKNPRAVANFWVDKIGFVEVKADRNETDEISVELKPNNTTDASIVLFDKSIVEKMSPELNLGTPSILFSSYDIKDMREKLISNGVSVGEVIMMNDSATFNFSDIEGNYFAVQEIEKN